MDTFIGTKRKPATSYTALAVGATPVVVEITPTGAIETIISIPELVVTSDNGTVELVNGGEKKFSVKVTKTTAEETEDITFTYAFRYSEKL